MRLLIILFLVPYAFASKGERFVLSAQGDYISGAESTSAFKLEGEFLSYQSYTIGIHFQNESRILFEDVVNDSRVGIHGSYKLPDAWSMKWRTSVSQEEDLFALFSVKGSFLWEYKKLKLELGLEHESFELLGQVQTFSAQGEYYFRKNLKFGGGINAANTTPTANELGLFVQLRRQGFEYQFDYRVGKKVEADDLLGDSNSYDFKINYNTKLGKNFYKIGPGLLYYDGTVRDETRLYLMLLGVF